MTLYTQDVYVKLFNREPTAAKAWKKLEDNFEKRSNARVIELRKRLVSMRLAKEQGIAEYLGELREIKVNLKAAGQTVTDVELGCFALQGLPKEYATLVEILELGETALSLDVIQPELMQREQRSKLEKRAWEPGKKRSRGGVATAYVAKRERFETVAKGSSQEGDYSRSADMRTCYACGGVGHVGAHCRMRNAECHKCGETGHIRAVCKKTGRGARGGGEFKIGLLWCGLYGFAEETHGRQRGCGLVDSGTTQHLTPDRRQFASYRKLASVRKTIEGTWKERPSRRWVLERSS